MLEDEIKAEVVKGMEIEKDKEKQDIKHKLQGTAYSNFRSKLPTTAKTSARKAPKADSEIFLDRKTLQRIEGLYNGSDKTTPHAVSNKQVINEILNIGRLEFLKTQKLARKGVATARPSAQKLKKNMAATTVGSDWLGSKNYQTPYHQTVTQYLTGTKQEQRQSVIAVNKIMTNRLGPYPPPPQTAEPKARLPSLAEAEILRQKHADKMRQSKLISRF